MMPGAKGRTGPGNCVSATRSRACPQQPRLDKHRRRRHPVRIAARWRAFVKLSAGSLVPAVPCRAAACRECRTLASARLLCCARATCNALAVLCRRCDRGQRYCSVACSVSARRTQLSIAAANYQRTAAGAENHRRRNRFWSKNNPRTRRRLPQKPDSTGSAAVDAVLCFVSPPDVAPAGAGDAAGMARAQAAQPLAQNAESCLARTSTKPLPQTNVHAAEPTADPGNAAPAQPLARTADASDGGVSAAGHARRVCCHACGHAVAHALRSARLDRRPCGNQWRRSPRLARGP